MFVPWVGSISADLIALLAYPCYYGFTELQFSKCKELRALTTAIGETYPLWVDEPGRGHSGERMKGARMLLPKPEGPYKQKFSQQDLAHELGLSVAQLRKWEAEGLPFEGRLVTLCRTLNVSADWLLGLSDEGGPAGAVAEPPHDPGLALRQLGDQAREEQARERSRRDRRAGGGSA